MKTNYLCPKCKTHLDYFTESYYHNERDCWFKCEHCCWSSGKYDGRGKTLNDLAEFLDLECNLENIVNIKIKYHDENMPRLKKIDKGDWIDLYLVDIVNLPPVRYNKAKDGWDIFEGDILQISLGISMELPKGYEAIISPRSSLFKRHRLILTNSIGVIDNAYNGNNDIWGGYLYCLKGHSFIKRYERILQFRILQNQPKDIKFQEVERLENKDRGGFGSTGY